MALLPLLLPTLIFPALVTGGFLFAAGQARRRRLVGLAAVCAALAVAAGYLSGYVAVEGWPPFPPTERRDWLISFIFAAALLTLLEALRPLRARIRRLLYALFLLALLFILIQPLANNNWSPSEHLAWFAGLGAALIAVSWTWEATAEQVSGAELAGVFLIVTVGSSLTLFESGSVRLAILAGILAGPLIVAAVTANDSGAASSRRFGIVPVVLFGSWLLGYFYSELPAAAAFLLAVAPVMAMPIRGKKLRPSHPHLLMLLRLAVVVIPAGAAVGLAAFIASRSQ